MKYGCMDWLIGLILALPAWTAENEKKAHPFEALAWRNIGPVNMSGRVADVEGVPGDPKVVYVGSASGGVWKTVDGGLTFQPLFDDQPIASIGDLALAPSNPAVIYVGSGEANTRNSVSFGNGVYKSTDGGRHWRYLGLEQTHHISRVLVHPQDPDVVFVGAVGHIYGPHEQRGVFRSRDGGETWEKTLYLDNRHGVSDMDMAAGNPNVLFAGLWYFERKPWTHTSGSKEGGVFKSIDGGKTWRKITAGLPETMGRIGVKVAPSNPDVVYVIAESEQGVLFRSDDQGEHFRKVSDRVNIVSRGFYYTDLRVDPVDENRVYAISSRLYLSIDGGRNFERISRNTHVDYHSLWIDPLDPNRLWQGQDGGVAVSYDRGDTWEPIRNLPLAQFYQIYADNREPFYYLGGGLQDNGTWYGPSRTREPAGILPDDWRMVSFGDAYWVVPHPRNPDIMISEFQGGGILKTDMRTRQQVDISPQPRRNDGGPVGELEYRFNWNAPILASPHDPLTVYFAGNVVFKSADFGEHWTVISPDLTTNDPEKQKDAGGPVWQENTTAEYHCTIISFAESPVTAGVLWAGTDDGNLQLSRDGGTAWENITANVPGVPAFSPVSHVEPSRAGAGGAYVSFDRHMFDDFQPHIFKTDNYGASWTRISGDLPASAWVWVVREDPQNQDLLYAGTELGLYATYDGGKHWQRLHLKNLPTVAVQDILIHPRENDLILGTHGRGIWVFDDATPLQRWPRVDQTQPAHLFPVRPALRFPSRFTRYGMGDKTYSVPNPPYGALIYLYLSEAVAPAKGPSVDRPRRGGRRGQGMRRRGGRRPPAVRPATTGDDDKAKERKDIKIQIVDGEGDVIRTLEDLVLTAGLNRVVWDLSHERPRPRRLGENGGLSEFFGPNRGPAVLPGTYTVRMIVGEQQWETPLEVRLDPKLETDAQELQKVHAMVLELRDMRSRVNDALRGLDMLTSQLEERRTTLQQMEKEQSKTLKEAWKNFAEAIQKQQHVFVREEGKPFWSQGPRLRDRLGDLSRNLDRGYRAPSAAQETYFQELKTEWQNAMTEAHRFFTEEVPQFNTILSQHDVSSLMLAAGSGKDSGESGGDSGGKDP